ncbi:MAG TPA: CheR family methyltransferase, partial [Methylophilaceae bacterium]|nr:CheR family methyltransferase [Methylophilaceae bacterium]
MTTKAAFAEREFSFTDKDFHKVRKLIYQHAGISLSEAKGDMVYSRLARRLRAVGLPSFAEYLDYLERADDSKEWEAFTNALTTNLTSFFREAHHFPILAEHLARAERPIAIWCSASSTGEEPYSIAMTCCEAFGTLKPPVEIIATDIDTNVLATAASGVYPLERIAKLDDSRRKKFFLKGSGANAGFIRVRDELRALIKYQPLNLLTDRWPLSGPFDAIFCRNVMIYFDKQTQAVILNKFAPLMKPDGLLFGGHSENFLYATNAFHLRGKTVYELNRSNKGSALSESRVQR